MNSFKSNKKGFTLVELLAIIVILGIISLITVPVVTSILKQSRKKAFQNSVEIATDVLREYLNENDYSKFELNGVKVTELKSYSANKFISGKFVDKDGIIEAAFITDGEFCAKGPIRELKIGNDCKSLDDTEAEVDNTKYAITSTTKSIKVILGDGFAIDEESGIKNYKVTVVGEGSKTSTKPETFDFTGLIHDHEYTVIIEITNGNNVVKTIETKVRTKAIDVPEIVIANENEWKQSKIVTFNAEVPSGAEMQYRIVNGTDEKVGWTTISNGDTYLIDYTSNVSTPTYIYTRISDGVNTVDAITKTQTKVDTTAPTCGSFSGGSTTWATSRKISVACNEVSNGDNSGCTKSSFDKSYTTQTTTDTPAITIKDVAGNSVNCKATSAQNIYVDKTAPNTNVPSAEATTKSITVTMKQTDAHVGTLGTRYYALKTGNTWGSWQTSNSNTYTFNNISKGQTYYVKTKACDSLGNCSGETDEVKVVTETFTYPVIAISNENEWKQSKTVTITGTTPTGTELQYRIKNGSTWKVGGDSTWVKYNGAYTINYTSNATTPTYVYARIYDGNSSNTSEAATKTQTKVDVTAPSCPTSYGGASTTWATSRNITAACSEAADSDNSGCTATSFKQTYTTTTKTATPSITIKDNAGNTRSCSPSSALNIYVDKTAPTNTKPDCTSSTGRVTVTIKQTDANVGTLSNIKYGYSTSENGTYTWGTSSAITGLTKGTNYYVKTQATDSLGNGPTTSAATLCSTKGQDVPTITYKSGSTSSWAQSKTVVFNIGTLQAQNKLQYRIKNGSSWKKADGTAASNDSWIDTTNGAEVTIDYESTATTPTYIYLRVVDTDNSSNVASSTTFTEATIDRTAPSCPTSYGGASTTWATSRNITAACSETANNDNSGCVKTSYSKSYTTTTKTATPSFTLADNAGNTRSCSPSSALNIYVDKTAPTNTKPDCTTSTGRVTITIKQTDANVGTLSNIKYGYSTSENGTYTWGTSSAITGLTKGTNYYVKTQATDSLGNGPTTSAATLCSTKGQDVPTITYKSGSTSSWAQSKTVVFNIGTLQAQNKLQYRIKNGSTWKVGGDSTWVDTTNGAEVTIDYESTATTPTYIYLRVVDTDNSSNVASSTTFTETKVDRTAPTVKTIYAGAMLYGNPNFSNGSNSVKVYNNSKNGTVTHERKSGTTPEGSYYIHIKTNGTASPGLGGFYFGNGTSANKVYITRIVAKIPTGYTLNWYSNATGDGRTNEWLTSQAGTGKWEEYINVTKCGSSGTFSTTSYFAISGTAATESSPVEWDVAYATVFDASAWAQTNYVISAAQDSLSGVIGYGLNQSSSTAPSFTTFTSTTNAGKVSSVTSNGTYYAWYKDGASITNKGSVAVSYVDRTAPTVAANGSSTTSTKSITVPVNITDTQVKTIKSLTCKAGTNTSNYNITGTGTLGTQSENITPGTCSFTGLTKNTKYYYLITATDILNNTTTAANGFTGNATTGNITAPTITIANESDWKNSKVVTFTGTIPSGANMQYKVVNGTTTKVDWTNVANNGTYTINYTSNATTPTYVYLRITDGTNTVDGTTKTQTKVDVTAPSCPTSYGGASTTWATSRNITAACSEAADSDNSGCTATSFKQTYTTTTKTATPSITIKDNAGNTRSCSPSSALNIYVDKTAPTNTKPDCTSSTGRVTVTIKQTDANVGTLSNIKYGYSTSENGTYTWGTSSAITGLTKGTNYYVKTQATDSLGNGPTTSAATLCSTKGQDVPTITYKSGSTSSWAQSKTVVFNIGTLQAQNKLQYRIKNGSTWKVGGDSTWVDTTNGAEVTIDYESTATTPTYIYLRVVDTDNSSNVASSTTFTEATIDRTAPTCGTWSGASTTWATSRSLSIKCVETKSGDASGCYEPHYGYIRAYNSTTVTAKPSVAIEDNAGNSVICKSSSNLNIYVDTTPPQVEADGTVTTTTSTASVPIKVTEENSGWKSTSCEYGTTTSYGSTANTTGTAYKCDFSKLTANTTYYYRIRVTDKVNNSSTSASAKKEVTGSFTTVNMCTPTITIANENDWKNSKVVTFMGTIPSGANMQYKVVNGTTTKVDWTNISSGGTYTINYTSTATTPTYVYSRCTDGTNIKDATTKTQTKVDVTAPSCPTSYGGASTTWATSRNITAACSETANNDNSGCVKTSYSKSYTTTTTTATPSFTLADNAGNTRSCSPSSAMNVYVDKTAPTLALNGSVTVESSSVIIPITATDEHVKEIDKNSIVCKAGTSASNLNITGTVTKGTRSGNNTPISCKFTGLSWMTKYYYSVTAKDSLLNGPTTYSNNVTTFDEPTVTIAVANENAWKQSKTVTISGSHATGAKIQYRVKNGSTWKVGGDSTWVDYSSAYTINYASNSTTSTVIYARITDGTNTTAAATKTQTMVDTTQPNISASKITYKDIPFNSNWNLSNASISSGVLSLTNNTSSSSYATSDYIDVNGGFYYTMFDAYSDNNMTNKSTAGIFWQTHYYNSSKSSISAPTGNTNDGHSINFTKGAWANNLLWTSIDNWRTKNRYGSNVKYIKINFASWDEYASKPVKARNLKVYAEEMPNSFYLINVSASDGESNIKQIKYATGSQTADYCKNSGTVVSNNQFRVTANNTYTVCAINNADNTKATTITINRIQNIASNTVNGTTTNYPTLQDAINASTGGETKLLADTTENVTIPSGYSKTLNLNGKTLTGNLTNRGTITVNGNGSIYGLMRNYGTYTMTNGTIYYATEGWLAYNEGTFNMNGGLISNSVTNDAVAFYNIGTATLKNGEFNSAGFGIVNQGGTLTADSITVTSDGLGVWTRSANTTGSTKIINSDITVSGSSAIGVKSSSIRTDIWNTNVTTHGGYIFNTDKWNTNTAAGTLYYYLMKTDGSACSKCTWDGGLYAGIPNQGTFVISKGSDNYTVRAYGYNSSYKVEFPTWTTANGQDDIKWHVGRSQTDGTHDKSKYHSYTIIRKEHNNETGTYRCHIYVTPSGSSRTMAGSFQDWTYKT